MLIHQPWNHQQSPGATNNILTYSLLPRKISHCLWKIIASAEFLTAAFTSFTILTTLISVLTHTATSLIILSFVIIDRSFLNMEILKHIFCAAALIGIHFTRPYLSLLLDTATTYDTLLEKFPLLYSDFSNIDSDKFLQADQIVESPHL